MHRWKSYRDKAARNLKDANVHILFTLRLARLQVESGRDFLFEHPQTAASWRLPEVQESQAECEAFERFSERYRVLEAVAHQCAYGLTARGDDGKECSVSKPMSFLTNAVEVRQELSKTCQGCSNHVRLEGSRAGPAAKYPKALCRAVCRGIMAQMKADAADLMAIDCVDDIGIWDREWSWRA